MAPSKSIGLQPKHSPGRRLLIAAGVIGSIFGWVGAGFGMLMWLTFDGILPMENGETFGDAVRVVDGYVSCFLVDDGEGELFLVDTCSDEGAEHVIDALSERGRTPEDVRAILFTHGHIDHTAGADRFKQAFVYAHVSERPLLEGEVAARGPLPRLSGRGPRIEVDEQLEDGKVFRLGRRVIQVFHLPGHTDGSVAYLIDETLFLGDNGHAMVDGRMESAPWVFTDDTALNRTSLRQLNSRLTRDRVSPSLLVFSHSGALERDALARWATEDPE